MLLGNSNKSDVRLYFIDMKLACIFFLSISSIANTYSSTLYAESSSGFSAYNRREVSKSLNNRIYADVQFLGVGFGYLKNIHNHFSLGVKAGLGAQKNIWITHPSFGANQETFFNERYHYGMFVHFSKSKNLQLEAGFRKIGYLWSDGDLIIANALNLAVFTGWEKVQVGISMNIGENKWDNFSYVSLLVFRIPVSRW